MITGLFLLITIVTATAETNSWWSNGTEIIFGPGYAGGSTIVTAIPWGDITTPPFNQSLRDDGAEWIGLTFTGGVDSLGDYWFVRSMTLIPWGGHSRMTFWGCADDSIVAVGLYRPGYSVQWFYPSSSDGNDADELIRIDMSDATVVSGVLYYLYI
ncbi:hypothetical protein KAH81_02945 [bacterium]|nr:hypothetical protein [bacterium]